MKSMLKSLMSVAVAALAFTSCSNDTTEDVMPNGGSKTLVVNATIDQTRTTMADNHVDLKWDAEDDIILYIGKDGAKNTIKPLSGGTIKGVDYQEGQTVYANYSIKNDTYSQGATQAEINIVASQTQTAANEFAGTNLPMVASGEIKDGKVDLMFHPIGCVLVFNVYGPAANENIKSIKFTTTNERCWGYKKCDLTAGLTAEAIGYEDSKLEGGGKSVTVELTDYATIGTSKPTDTKKGENQVYLVVAPFNYTAATFTVTTDAGSYTFKTANGIDCSTSTARVVNLNLAKSPEGKPSIVVPTDPIENSSSAQKNLSITGIQFKNIADISNVEVGAFSDAELKNTLANSWITFVDNGELSEGTLRYDLAANDGTNGSDGTERTAYIGIKCGDAQASIAVTQLAKGKFVTTYVPTNMNYTDQTEVKTPADLDNGNVTLTFDKGVHDLFPRYWTSELRCYDGNTITVTSSTSNILKIEIVRGNNNSSKVSVNGSDLTKNNNTFTWTGESDNVVLNFSTATFYLASMKIYYGEDNEPRIEAPKVDQQPAAGGDLTIENIVIKNIDVATVSTGVYSDAELTKQENVDWLTISNPAATLADGVLNCVVAANTGAERTAYIGIKGGGVQAAIAVTQKAQGAVDKYFVKVTENLDDWTGDYLIVYEDGNKAFNGALTSGFGTNANNVKVTITEERILSDETTNALLVKISKKEGATGEYMYMLQTASGYFLYSSSEGSTNIIGNNDRGTAAPYPHSININDDGSAIIKSTSGRFWKYSPSSNYFRYFKETSSGMNPVQLYKLQE